jgi:hypothetical protein
LTLFTVLAVIATTGGAAAQEEPAAGVQAALGTGFTYQGRLTENGNPASGAYDFEFRLYDAVAGGNQVGSTMTHNDVPVTNGTFTALLDFGANTFTGEARWLEVAVRPGASTGSYTTLSPRQPITPAPYALALPGLYTQLTSEAPNVIGGFQNNSVSPGVIGATISGGGGLLGTNDFSNRVVLDYGTVGGGFGNVVSGTYGTIAGGYYGTVTSPMATVAGGGVNTAGGSFATVSGGRHNVASGDYATVPGGDFGLASHHGEMAYAAGMFFNRGDAQTSLYVMRRATTTSGVHELFLDGGSDRLTIAGGRTLVFDIHIVGRSNTGASAGWRIQGMIENVNGEVEFVGSPTETLLGSNMNASVTASVSADGVLDALRVNVVGINNTSIRWVATVRTVEVSW